MKNVTITMSFNMTEKDFKEHFVKKDIEGLTDELRSMEIEEYIKDFTVKTQIN